MNRLPPASFYAPATWPAWGDRVLARSWHVVASVHELGPEPVVRELLPGSLNEPLVLVKGADGVRAFSAVCTHRAAVLAPDGPGLRCPYHGRRFDSAGRCRSAPGFGAPTQADHLVEVPTATWGPLVFASLQPAMPFEALFPWERLSFLPPIAGAPDPAGNQAFEIDAHFALYVENYLEGLHVPFVHPGLTQALDLPNYRTELLGASSLQIGAAVANSPAFDTPDGRVGGYYIALFPTTLLNLYPWGLSLNLVEPLGPERTQIRYQRWVRDPALLDSGAGSGLDTVEAEDDAIVELVQRGLRSRLARPGQASPRWEAGLSAFHAQLRALLDDPEPFPR